MADKKPTPKQGDPCPNCDSDFMLIPAPSDAQRAAAKDRDNPVPLPPFVDSADPTQIDELGELYECARCHYRTRIQREEPEPARAPAPAPQAAAPAPDDRAATLERENAELRRQLAERPTAPTTGA
jgi:hypothetical protein